MSRFQSRRFKVAKKGIPFTIMVVGPSGLGRSTFVNTLCEKQVLPYKQYPPPEKAHEVNSMTIKPVSVDLDEGNGMKIALTVVNIPGFGDGIENEDSFQEILDYIEKQYDAVLEEETRVRRNPKFQDNRVHALLYFITPTGHSLRELDIELMRKLGNRVNVIPVIGRADSFTAEELKAFKQRIMEDIEYYQIPIYNFSYDLEDEDEEIIKENRELRSMLPFAIVGSDEEIVENGEPIRVRQYPWGRVEIDNEDHCDFARLRYLLLNSHLSDLKEITHDFLYENYRTEKLSVEDDNDEE